MSGFTRNVLRAEGYFWRDDPSRFPLTTWHAVAMGEQRAACGFGPYGDRQTTQISETIACPDCLALVKPSVAHVLHFTADGMLAPHRPQRPAGTEGRA